MKSIELTGSGSINSRSAVADLAEQQRLKMLSPRKWFKGDFSISTDKTLLNTHFLFSVLSHHDSDKRHIALALRGSLCFGVYRNERQIGFARIVSDLAGTAIIRDIYISPEYRFIGLGSWLLSCCLTHPAMHKSQTVIGWGSDASHFLKKNGFKPVENMPEMHLVQVHAHNVSGQFSPVH